ncbi:uncharacterized protein LOC132564444 [Ylistrum balloti]|uniref:uncharacterized protein LOC132564444 n=1 Tax=Ylistrum balloti TaxID=509963 RepID=UPI002905C783|nr:uncharacterized protein LOC132564444 [Ylistrum balloti]
MERCSRHPGERTELFCEDCNYLPVCNSCITTLHAGHRFKKTSEVKGGILAKLREKKEENTRIKQKLEQDLRKNKKEILRQNENHSQTFREIESRKKEVKKEIDKQEKQLEDECQIYYDRTIANLQKSSENIKRRIKKRTKYEADLSRLMNTDKVSDLVRQFELVTAPVEDEVVVPEMPLPSPRFIPGNGYSPVEMFGRIEEQRKTHLYDKIGPRTRNKVITHPTENDDDAYASLTPSRCSSFSMSSGSASVPSLCEEAACNIPRVSLIQHCKINIEKDAVYIALSSNSENCWVKNQDQSKLTLVNRSGTEMKEQIPFSDKIGGFSGFPGGKLLVCLPDQKLIQQVDTYSVLDIVSTAPFTPRCVQSGLFDGKIVAIVYDQSIAPEPGPCELVRYNSNGEEEKRINVDRFGNNLFYCSEKISFNRTGTKIAVLNHRGPRRSDLVIINRNLEPMWRYFGDAQAYQGHENIDPRHLQNDTNMCLTDVVFDYKDNVVIADRKTNTVKLLNQRMEHLKILGTYMAAPVALAMDYRNHNLFVKDDSDKLCVMSHVV